MKAQVSDFLMSGGVLTEYEGLCQLHSAADDLHAGSMIISRHGNSPGGTLPARAVYMYASIQPLSSA